MQSQPINHRRTGCFVQKKVSARARLLIYILIFDWDKIAALCEQVAISSSAPRCPLRVRGSHTDVMQTNIPARVNVGSARTKKWHKGHLTEQLFTGPTWSLFMDQLEWWLLLFLMLIFCHSTSITLRSMWFVRTQTTSCEIAPGMCFYGFCGWTAHKLARHTKKKTNKYAFNSLTRRSEKKLQIEANNLSNMFANYIQYWAHVKKWFMAAEKCNIGNRLAQICSSLLSLSR